MRLLTCFTAFALVGLLVATPVSNDEKVVKVVITPKFYNEKLIKYTAEHDIVKLTVPLNSLNLDETDYDSSDLDKDILLFFVEADIQLDGSRVDQGLYVFKEGKAKKILDYGRDAAAPADDSKKAFFGAKDGLYVYNYTTNSADKYGPIADSIIAIEAERSGEVIYILTEDGEVYKVTENGEKKEKLDDVVKTKQIALDSEDNLYFFSDDKKLYVRTADGVKKIEGLPESIGTATLIRPPIFAVENGGLALIDNNIYVLYPNGTSEKPDFKFETKALPTAVGLEAALIQYYGYDKKIFEFNVMELVVDPVIEDIAEYIEKKETEIRKFASKKTSLKRKLQPANLVRYQRTK